MKNNHRTIFTQSLADGQTLDAPTARLIQYFYCPPAFEKFSDNHRTVLDARSGVTLAHHVRISMMMFSVLLMMEATSRLPHLLFRRVPSRNINIESIDIWRS